MLQQQGSGQQLAAVTDDTFAQAVLGSDRPVVVDFWAEWCAPCKAMERSLGELAGEFGDRVAVVKMNTDENPTTARTYGVMSLPTVLVFRGGEVVGSLIGAKPKSTLREKLTEYAGS